jgi:UDP-2,3-diacylglucosamine hydrolase
MWIGFKWSASRHQYTRKTLPFQGDNEHIIKYIRSIAPQEKADCYIFGHRHIDVEHALGNGQKYINTGAWYHKSPYAVMEEDGEVRLKEFDSNDGKSTTASER